MYKGCCGLIMPIMKFTSKKLKKKKNKSDGGESFGKQMASSTGLEPTSSLHCEPVIKFLGIHCLHGIERSLKRSMNNKCLFRLRVELVLSTYPLPGHYPKDTSGERERD